MLANYNHVVHLLEMSGTAEVTRAEQYMKKMALENIQVLACLQTAMRDANLKEPLRLLAGSYINALLLQQASDLSDQQLFTYFRAIFYDENIDWKDKRALGRSMVKVFEQTEIEDQWVRLIVELSTAENRNTWICTFLLLQWSLEGGINCENLRKVERFLFEESWKCFLREMEVHEIIYSQEIVRAWTYTLDKFINQEMIEEIEFMANSEIFSRTIFKIYEYGSSQDFYICINSDFEDFLVNVNELKEETAVLHHKILEKVCKISHRSKLYLKTGEKMNHIVKTISSLAASSAIVEIYSCESFAIQLLKIFNKFLQSEPSILSECWQRVLRKIIYPFILMSETQKRLYYENTEQFIGINQDCCENQIMDSIKSQSCKLLEILADNSEKIGKGEEIMQCILADAVRSIKAKLGMISDFEDSLEIEASFLILSIFSYILKENTQTIQELRIILCDERLKNINPIQFSRILIFLSYCFFDVFSNAFDGRHWIQYSLTLKTDQTLNFCCVDFLFNVVDQFYSDEILEKLIMNINTNTLRNFWPLLTRLVEIHLKNFPQNLSLALVKSCLQRVYHEVNMIQARKKADSTAIQYILHIFKVIVLNREYCERVPDVKLGIWNVMEKLHVLNDLNEDGQILQLFIVFLETPSIQQVPELVAAFPVICDILSKSSFYSQKSLAVLSYYSQNESSNFIHPTFHIVIQGLNNLLCDLSDHPSKTLHKISIGNHIILLQILLYKYGKVLNDHDIENIQTLVMKLLPGQKDKKPYDRILIARALNVIFLCHMLKPFPNHLDLLLQFHDEKIYYNYDIQVLLQLVSCQIMRETDQVVMTQYLNVLIRVISWFSINKEKQEAVVQKSQSGKSNKVKIKFQRYLNYEAIIKSIKSPFIVSESLKNSLEGLIKTLASKNNELWNSIRRSFTKQVGDKLESLCRKNKEEKGERTIVKIRGIKKISDQRNQSSSEQKRGGWLYASMQEEQEEQDDEQLKNRRIRIKKRRKYS